MIKRGDILVVRNIGWLSKAIRVLTKGYYNHVGVFISETELVEATFKEVAVSPLAKFVDMYNNRQCEFAIYRPKNATPDQIDMIVDFAEAQVGRKYDFAQLLSIGLFICFKVGRKHEPIDLRKYWICTELVGEAYESAGIRLDDKIDSDSLSATEITNSKHLERVF